MSVRYNKAGAPTTLAIAEAIATLRDLLFREYALDAAFSVAVRGAVIAAAGPVTIHAVVREVLR